MASNLSLRQTGQGLSLDWTCSNGLNFNDLPVRLELRGSNAFYVWGAFGGDSGESAPVWADPKLLLNLFDAPEAKIQVQTVAAGRTYRAIGTVNHVQATLEVSLIDDELNLTLGIQNLIGPNAAPLPLCRAELSIGEMRIGSDATFLTANAYGGRTFGYGRIDQIQDPGLMFSHGCIGLNLPLACLHQPQTDSGIQVEFMLQGRPQLWLKPDSDRTPSDRVNLSVVWEPDRRLAPGENHSFGGALRLKPFTGRPVVQIRRWRDEASSKYGFVPPPCPDWARDMNIIEFHMMPGGTPGISRLDDPACLAQLKAWRAMGYNAIFAVTPNKFGVHWLSPYDYDPADTVGGPAAETQCLKWAHDLGFNIFLWITTVGVDRDSPLVKQHADWFTHRYDGSLFYAWDSGPKTNFVGYAPDGDPLSLGWRKWLEDQAVRICSRGYDGVYIDGCIPRASNHARWSWPGEGRNAVEDQVASLSKRLRALKPNLITFVEDESLSTQIHAEVVQGRYCPMPPRYPKAYWDLGMGGGPQVNTQPAAFIEPEKARDYLITRYASLLPHVVTNDILEGYICEEGRPWVVQSLMCGCVPKTHSNYIEDPAKFVKLGEADAPSAKEQEPAHRLKGHEEFVGLLKYTLATPLLRQAPLSIEGVEITGDDAVVGIVRPGKDKMILALIQFANRAATVSVKLAPPGDVPSVQRTAAGSPETYTWEARESLKSMVNPTPTSSAKIGNGQAMQVSLGAYGFRVFELTRTGK
jgi:hypothetical protein